MDARCLGDVGIGAAMHMARSTHAVPMADFEPTDAETIADFNVASSATFSKGDVTAFLEALEGHEAHATVFVGKVGPNNVVEDVCFDRVDREGQCSEPLGSRCVVEGGRVDHESGHVVQVRVCNQIRRNMFPDYVQSVRPGTRMGEWQSSKCARLERDGRWCRLHIGRRIEARIIV